MSQKLPQLSKGFFCFLIIIRWSIRRSRLFPLLPIPDHNPQPLYQPVICPTEELHTFKLLLHLAENPLNPHVPFLPVWRAPVHHSTPVLHAVTPAESQPLPRVCMRSGSDTSFSYRNALLVGLASLLDSMVHATLPGGNTTRTTRALWSYRQGSESSLSQRAGKTGKEGEQAWSPLLHTATQKDGRWRQRGSL